MFAAMVCLWWSAINLLDVAIYCADSRAGELMLLDGLTGKESDGHDWNADRPNCAPNRQYLRALRLYLALITPIGRRRAMSRAKLDSPDDLANASLELSSPSRRRFLLDTANRLDDFIPLALLGHGIRGATSRSRIVLSAESSQMKELLMKRARRETGAKEIAPDIIAELHRAAEPDV